MRSIITAALLCLVVAGVAIDAKSGSIGLYSGPAATDCGLPDNGPGLVTIYVVVTNSPGLTAVQFSAPLPDCWSGAAWISETSPYIPIGNSQDGVAIAFGSCLATPIHVLTINVFASGLVNTCCPYHVLPDADAVSGEIEFIDCDFNVITGYEYPSFVTSDGSWAPPLVDDPQPPDGAAFQPLDAQLSWRIQQCSCGLGVVWNTVFFGTTPDPPMVADYLDDPFYDPGPLAPATTYYWKVRVFDSDVGMTESPIWTFTTNSGVPAGVTTWGKVKALYTH